MAVASRSTRRRSTPRGVATRHVGDDVLSAAFGDDGGHGDDGGDGDDAEDGRPSKKTDASVKRQEVSKHTFGMEDEDTCAEDLFA